MADANVYVSDDNGSNNPESKFSAAVVFGCCFRRMSVLESEGDNAWFIGGFGRG